jgi:glucose-6-phosphate 1-dehydrogenase
MSKTLSEILVELKPPPQQLFADSWPATGLANYLSFQLAPDTAIALAARVKRAGEEFLGDQRELLLLDTQPDKEQPYERLVGDAMAGNGALFTREDTVEGGTTRCRLQTQSEQQWRARSAAPGTAPGRSSSAPDPTATRGSRSGATAAARSSAGSVSSIPSSTRTA